MLTDLVSTDRARRLLAGIRRDMDIVEYHAYHRLALAWAGLEDPDELLRRQREEDAGGVDFATLAFGVAHMHLCRGDTEVARALLAEIERGPSWHAFGHIAAEVELARLD